MELFLHYLGMPYLLRGIGFTIAVTALGLAGGVVVGLVLVAMQLSRVGPLAALARGYTVIFRGTPLILQLVFAYDALPHIGLKLSAIGAAGLALAANEGPFIAEILRAGVLGVERGQLLAGQALGMTPSVLMRRVIAPQAIRAIVPALGNESVSALKNSSLASVIAVDELTLRSTQLASSTFDFFSIFFASGLMYLILTGAVAVIQLIAEAALDLDRPASGGFARLLPWRRAAVTEEAAPGARAAPRPEPFTADPLRESDSPTRRPAYSRADHAKRYAELARQGAAVKVSALRKQYGKQPVLDGFDLTVRFGEVVVVLGPSGSGKSTLLRCINHLEHWDAGEIRIDGRRVGFRADGRPMTQHDIANERASIGVGMVFQQFNLFSHLSACENIAGPLRWVHGMGPADAERRAHELLERVGLGHRAHALPRHLSGGQQQRVAIARALAPNPRVLLLDEPTSALDPELVGEVLDVIQRLAIEDGLTMIISTHQLRFADQVADRVVFMSGGMVVEEGPAHDVLTHPRHPLTSRFLSVMGADSGFEVAS
ncbi:UNVERIFIED_ORG: amino acid ABC transporter membrane protein (PAAT family) /amino acid ABC transporter ATP-binding protein (PAAT family) [Burkholderia sp. CF145]|uniref:amino acid ABC transporter permease/ATP-binding protein n=1 Tax=Paraburkholderia hospita TaxID=169430 RepID=UPI00027168F7|nr:amino acid ABC transporter permease/ATP-binding protein [Paraburkholderia hospita]EUC20062.1 polar amino acid ABC transporter, inner membrane subunit [Burkholderia sp. BT03]SKD06078.1 amino acid ABC transporter membrane protein, PAAT family /amino acid ABC transporter ATP-binding protein, PAAT family [Paraburkholderia hospita]